MHRTGSLQAGVCLAALVTLTTLTPRAVAAQQAPAPPAASVPPTAAPPATAGEGGFAIQSSNGDFQLRIGALVHLDGRFGLDDENAGVADTFLVRRLRPYLRGRLSRRFEFYLNPDFAVGTLVLQDAYVDTVFAPSFRLRMGKAKTPFGLERLQSAASVLFFERAFPSALVPNRDVGVQVLGDLAGGAVSYMGAIVNGAPDGGSVDFDTGDSKDLAGRLVLRPFQTRPAAHPLRGAGVAFAATTGRQSGVAALPTYRSASLLQPFFSYSGASADGRRTRYSPQAFYFYGPFGGFAEYVRSEMPIVKGPLREDIANSAWQVSASYVLTGEATSDGSTSLRPLANFDPDKGHWGAFQVAARYHALRVDEMARTAGFAATGASLKAEAWTLGLNWYLTTNFRYIVNFERTVFDGRADGPRPAENALAFRTQINF